MRRVRGADGQPVSFELESAACHHFKELHGAQAAWPAHFVQAVDVSAEDQLGLMTTVQSYVDNAISKTVWLRQSANPLEVGVVLHRAWELGLKGCAVYREGSRPDEALVVVQRREAPGRKRSEKQGELI